MLRRLIPMLVLPLAVGMATAGPAWADGKNWSIDYESSVEGTNNLEQSRVGNADLTWRNNLELSYFPAADADNSALFKIQALNQRYAFNPAFNSTYFIGTALASRRIYDSMFGYGGDQLLYKQANTNDGTSRQDNDLFGGLVQYLPIGSNILVFHGYQYDFLRAAVSETSYQGHSLYATCRHYSTERWTNSVNLRSQLRWYDVIGQMDWRNELTLESDYQLLSWWTLEGQAIYVNSTSTILDYNFGAWNVGVFSRFFI